MIKALIFDLDDTLYNEKDYVFGAFKEVSKYISYKYSLNELMLYNDMVYIFYQYGRGKIFNIVCDKYSIDEDINLLVDIYRNTMPKLYLYDDAKKILEWAKKEGLKLGVITDGCSKVQWSKIKSLNLQDIFDKIIVTDDFGKKYWKPHKKAYLETIKFFNLDYKECIYIGDNPYKDFITCKKIGINTIRIMRKQGDYMNVSLQKEYEADVKVNNLRHIKDIIKKF